MLVLPERAAVLLACAAQFRLMPKLSVYEFPAFLEWKTVIKPHAAQADRNTPYLDRVTYPPYKGRFDRDVIGRFR
jgi:hypothetical protein